jgi:hypothetical protein
VGEYTFFYRKRNENHKYRVEVSIGFAALEDLDAGVKINGAWEMIRENIKTSAKGSVGYFD